MQDSSHRLPALFGIYLGLDVKDCFSIESTLSISVNKCRYGLPKAKRPLDARISFRSLHTTFTRFL
jgi:hypothetical protein